MIYASDEEKYFSWYLSELQDAGYIRSYISQPESYVLSAPFFYEYDKHLKTKTNIIVQKFVHEHIYTPDFRINWNSKARGLFFNTFDDRINVKKIPFVAMECIFPYSIIEVKADFSKHNMTRVANLNQQWVMAKYGQYVQRAIVSNKTGIFKTTFTPIKYLFTDKSKKLRKIHFETRILKEFIDNNKDINK